MRQYGEREVISKCLQTFEQVCEELKAYLAQNETANTVELAQVKAVLVEVFNRAPAENGDG